MPRKDSQKKSVAKSSTAKRYTSAPDKLKPANVKAQPSPVANASSIDRSIIAAHVAALRNSDADFACDAALALGAIGDVSAVEPLILALRNGDGFYHSVVRAAAAGSLGRIGDARAVEPLLAAVRDSIAEPSAEAIRALGALADIRAIATLLEVVRNPNGYFLPVARKAAVMALGTFKSDALVADELKAISNNPEEDSVIRQAAGDAISQPGSKPRTPRSH